MEERLPHGEAPPRLSRATAAAHIAAAGFRPGPVGLVGAELEVFVLAADDPLRIPSPQEVGAALRGVALPGATALSFEPGGQLELSALPARGVARAVEVLAADLEVVEKRLGAAGLRVRGGALEETRTPRRWVRGFRYDAMSAHFEACGPASAEAGRVMMTATAALQVNLDAGEDAGDIAARWRRAHTLAPVLAAAFANSPVLAGNFNGSVSRRLEAWECLDPCRTASAFGVCDDADPAGQWAAYALDATVFVVPDDAGGHLPTAPFTLAEWVDNPDLGGRPVTRADLDYHLTTLFPPVRPRGFLELRYLDGQRLDHWPVALAVTAAVHDDPRAARDAEAAADPVRDRWHQAARDGVADPPLGAAARDVLRIAEDSLRRSGSPTALLAAVGEFRTAYTDVGRCPAHDLLVAAPSPTVTAGAGG